VVWGIRAGVAAGQAGPVVPAGPGRLPVVSAWPGPRTGGGVPMSGIKPGRTFPSSADRGRCAGPGGPPPARGRVPGRVPVGPVARPGERPMSRPGGTARRGDRNWPTRSSSVTTHETSVSGQPAVHRLHEHVLRRWPGNPPGAGDHNLVRGPVPVARRRTPGNADVGLDAEPSSVQRPRDSGRYLRAMVRRAQEAGTGHLEIFRGLPGPVLVSHFDQVAGGLGDPCPGPGAVHLPPARTWCSPGRMPTFDVVFLRNV
jgi:hypothetical protein